MTDTTRPWVLLRKRLPPQRFDALDGAKRFYDRLRANGGRSEGAVVFGPNGEGWYVAAGRESSWFRDDARRTREEPAVEDATS